MKPFTAFAMIAVAGALAACQSDNPPYDNPQYDGVSRFAGSSITAPTPGTPISTDEEPAPPLPDLPTPGPEGPDLSVSPGSG